MESSAETGVAAAAEPAGAAAYGYGYSFAGNPPPLYVAALPEENPTFFKGCRWCGAERRRATAC